MDYVYRKNLRWLETVKDKRKALELDLEEKRVNYNKPPKMLMTYNTKAVTEVNLLIDDDNNNSLLKNFLTDNSQNSLNSVRIKKAKKKNQTLYVSGK